MYKYDLDLPLYDGEEKRYHNEFFSDNLMNPVIHNIVLKRTNLAPTRLGDLAFAVYLFVRTTMIFVGFIWILLVVPGIFFLLSSNFYSEAYKCIL